MAEATVAIAARQRPPRCSVKCRFHFSSVGPEMPESENCIEGCVAVAGWWVDKPASVGMLVLEHSLEYLFRLWHRLADQAIVVDRVKGRGDVVLNVAVVGLHHQGLDFAVGFRRNVLAGGQVRQREKAR